MLKWLHHLFNPHCEHCRMDAECKNCDSYKQQIDMLTRQNQQLLDKLIQPEVIIREAAPTKENKPVATTKYLPFAVRQQMLEESDRKTAELMKKRGFEEPKTTEELEQELGVNHG